MVMTIDQTGEQIKPGDIYSVSVRGQVDGRLRADCYNSVSVNEYCGIADNRATGPIDQVGTH